MDLTQQALKSIRPSRYSEWHKDKKSLKDEIDALLARGLETDMKETNNGLNKREKQMKDEIDSLKLTLVRAKKEFDLQLNVRLWLEEGKAEIKKKLEEREKEVNSLTACLRIEQIEIQMGENTLNKKHKKEMEQIIQDTDEVITSIKNEDMELADTNLPLKEKEKKLLDEIDTLKSSSVKARNDFDIQLKAAKGVQGGLETEMKEIKHRLTEREKEVNSLNADLQLHQAETQEVKTELMKACEKKVEQMIREKDQILASVKTENTVLADRNLELMAKLKAFQIDFLEGITSMKMKITALNDSLRTEETEKEFSLHQIKELESHRMDTEEKCLESKGDRKEEQDEIEEGTGKKKKPGKRKRKKMRGMRKGCARQ